MRFLRLLKADIHFQICYGFYVLYAILTAMYLLVLFILPQSIRHTVATVTIFSDPVAIGLFFMGAIVLLEKSQRVNASLAVSPIKIWEYIGAKAISIAVIGTLVAIIICVAIGTDNLILVVIAVFASSILFSLCGLLVAMKVDTLNKFILATIPFQIVIFMPAMLYLFGIFNSQWFFLHPGIAAIALIDGNTENAIICISSLLCWSLVIFLLCHKVVKKSFSEMGGGKL